MTKTKGFDLGSIDTVRDCNAGAEIELRHPTTNKPLGVFVSILGRDSDAFRDMAKAQHDADERKAFAARKRGKTPEPKTADEQEVEAVELLAAVVTGWRTEIDGKSVDTITFGEEELAFNGNNVKKVLNKLLWVRRQIDEELGNLENFTKA